MGDDSACVGASNSMYVCKIVEVMMGGEDGRVDVRLRVQSIDL